MKYDFDRISFIVDAVDNEYYGTEGSEYLTQHHKDLKVTVVINDVRIGGPAHVDIYSLVMKNTKCKSDWGDWSAFYPWTCSCGDAGCAGIWSGISVRERGYSIEWRAKSEDGYGFLPKSFFNYEKTAYKRAFDDLLAQIVGLCSDYPNTILVVDAGYCEEQLVTGLDFLEYVRENLK